LFSLNVLILLFCSVFTACRSSPFNETTNEHSRGGHGKEEIFKKILHASRNGSGHDNVISDGAGEGPSAVELANKIQDTPGFKNKHIGLVAVIDPVKWGRSGKTTVPGIVTRF
jgi:hypothetical protein